METVAGLLLAWVVVFAVNVMPAFMPPSWGVMAAFHITAGLPLLPLTIGGAAASALGRAVLALLSRRLGDRLPAADRANVRALGALIDYRRRPRVLLVFGYCLGPFPSNPLFIAAGVAGSPLLPLAIIFFLSRALADTFWVWTAHAVSHSVGGLFVGQLTSWPSIVSQIATVVLIALVFRLPWARWLGIGGARPAQGASGERTADASPEGAGSATKTE